MKKSKNQIIIALLIVSLGINVFIFGKWIFIDQWVEPTSEEKIILSEMVQKSIESESYKEIEGKENIIAIDVNKSQGTFPYNLQVAVKTDKQTYLFFCTDESCSNVDNEGRTYSIYEEESPRLPLNEN
jgi:hypothetical protein